MDYKDKIREILKDNTIPEEQRKKLEEILLTAEKSEDERIRKELITHCRNTRCVTEEGAERIAKWIAWLEKQENKPQGKTALEAIKEEKIDNANKVEPKFKEGDWIVFNGLILLVNEVVQGYYRTISIGGIPNSYDWNIDNVARLWTIQDAKDGDVLYLKHDGKEHIIIYKGVIKERFRTFVSAYCAYNGIVDAFCFADVSRYADIAYGGIMPATKEQRELLWQKMKEAGYMWDSDSKQLLSLKAEPNNEKKPAWSEEDENNLTDTCVAIRKFYHGTNGAQELIDWLKSLKERVVWKPSKKQIRALRWVLNNIPYNTHKEEISGLLEQIQNI